MSLYAIKHRNGTVLATQEADTLKDALELLVRAGAYLTDADLTDANLRDAYLRGAYLRGANLGGANLRDAYLRGAYLRDAYLRGAYLRGANLGGADLRGANLGGADLRGANLRDAYLRGAYLTDADLRGAYLRGANLGGADLRGANLTDANLRGAYLAGAQYYTVLELHTKMLAAIEAGGTLDMSTWHTCDTTHCRAGWAIHLAGDAGRLLEAQIGSSAAGALIHQASCPWMEKLPDFYASNEDALADIKRCAEREQQELAKAGQ